MGGWGWASEFGGGQAALADARCHWRRACDHGVSPGRPGWGARGLRSLSLRHIRPWSLPIHDAVLEDGADARADHDVRSCRSRLAVGHQAPAAAEHRFANGNARYAEATITGADRGRLSFCPPAVARPVRTGRPTLFDLSGRAVSTVEQATPAGDSHESGRSSSSARVEVTEDEGEA